jgi:hypothetical protein
LLAVEEAEVVEVGLETVNLARRYEVRTMTSGAEELRRVMKS